MTPYRMANTFKDMVLLTHNIIDRFTTIEQRPWGVEGSMMELTKQVGDLTKIVMTQENYYFKEREQNDPNYHSNKDRIGNELADIIYATIRVARHYNIDLEKAYLKARAEEDAFLKSMNK